MIGEFIGFQNYVDAVKLPAFKTVMLNTMWWVLSVVGISTLLGFIIAMVLNQKFVNDVKYIQRRFHIQGGEVPDETFVVTMQHYVRELEQHMAECKRNNVTGTQIPEWAHKLMRDRYGVKLHG